MAKEYKLQATCDKKEFEIVEELAESTFEGKHSPAIRHIVREYKRMKEEKK